MVANFDVIIDVGRLMDVGLGKAIRGSCFGLFLLHRLVYRRSLKTGGRAGQDTENTQALAAIGARRCPDLDAIKEMLTLGLQGLAWLERNGDGLCLQRARHTVPPIDAVGKHHKLALPWLAVI